MDGHAGVEHDAIGGHKMSLRAARFSPVKPHDPISAAAWFGLALLGAAVAVIMLGAVFPKFFGPDFNLSGLGFP
jgi:hypothetical protein